MSYNQIVEILPEYKLSSLQPTVVSNMSIILNHINLDCINSFIRFNLRKINFQQFVRKYPAYKNIVDDILSHNFGNDDDQFHQLIQNFGNDDDQVHQLS